MIAAPPLTLADFLRREFLPRKLGIAVQTAKLWHTVVNRIGGEVRLDAISDSLVMGHLTEFAVNHSPVTTNNQRRRLLQLWVDAAELGYCDPPRRKIPRVREREPEPEAWTAEEFARILVVCRALPPREKLPWRAIFWETLWLAAYWTAARIGSLLACTIEDWDSARSELRLRARCAKNRRGQRCRLPPDAATLIAAGLAAAPGRVLLWHWPYCREWLFDQARWIVEQAGVPCPPHESRQLFHRARRTCISYCWAVDPAIAQRTAGHASATLTRRNYVDPRIGESRTAIDVLPALDY